MGISYSGGMIVGADGADLEVPEGCEMELWEWAEEMDLEWMCPYYDAPIEDSWVGFTVENVEISEMSGEWLDDVIQKAVKFKKLTGVEPMLIGCQNVC